MILIQIIKTIMYAPYKISFEGGLEYLLQVTLFRIIKTILEKI